MLFLCLSDPPGLKFPQASGYWLASFHPNYDPSPDRSFAVVVLYSTKPVPKRRNTLDLGLLDQLITDHRGWKLTPLTLPRPTKEIMSQGGICALFCASELGYVPHSVWVPFPLLWRRARLWFERRSWIGRLLIDHFGRYYRDRSRRGCDSGKVVKDPIASASAAWYE